VLAEAEAPAKPKRAPRKSAKKVEAAVEETPAIAELPAIAPVEIQPEPTPEPAPEPKKVEDSKPVVTSSSAKEKKAEGEPAPKRGWWQKKGFF
jgi:ribonuclease E